MAVFRLGPEPSGNVDLSAGLVGPTVQPGSSYKQWSAKSRRRPGLGAIKNSPVQYPPLKTKRRRTGISPISRSQTSCRGTSQAADQGTQPGIATNRAQLCAPSAPEIADPPVMRKKIRWPTPHFGPAGLPVRQGLPNVVNPESL